MRKKVIAGNWKMNKTVDETKVFFDQILKSYTTSNHDVFFFVPYLDLQLASELIKDSDIRIGAQNMHYEDNGAYTGEISAPMLTAVGIDLVLIGHSERRQYYAETNQTVNFKIKKALTSNMTPVVCIGEDLEQRKSGQTFDVLKQQIQEGFESVAYDERLIVAYEPIWAIGTGETATGAQAEEACAKIREYLSELYADESNNIRILYGGSVKADNAKELLNMPNIDGALVGGASLTEGFLKIIEFDQ